MTRRNLIKLGASSLVAAGLPMLGLERRDRLVTEKQKGDPDVQYEKVVFDSSAIQKLASGSNKALFERWDQALPMSMIKMAQSFLGCSRATSPAQIINFLQLFGLPLKDNQGYVAFCAAGISYSALRAYLLDLNITAGNVEEARQYLPDIEHYYFYPTVSCVDMHLIAAGKRRWLDRKRHPHAIPKPGWIVIYDWSGTGTPDHCGIVVNATAEKMRTIEFNTSGWSGGSQRDGGTVSEKKRPYSHVKGFVITDNSGGWPA